MIDLPQRLQQMAADVYALEQSCETEGSNRTRELLQTVLDFHRAGLAHLLDLIHREGEVGCKIVEKVAQDALVGNLLLLHGLHPTDVETRTTEALERVRPFLHSQGAEVELMAIADDAVRLQLHQDGNGYPASLPMLRAAIEEAIATAAPDVRRIEFIDRSYPQTYRVSLPVLPSSVWSGAK
jgi:Fe-S cluster biogenesis protein NfuA